MSGQYLGTPEIVWEFGADLFQTGDLHLVAVPVPQGDMGGSIQAAETRTVVVQGSDFREGSVIGNVVFDGIDGRVVFSYEGYEAVYDGTNDTLNLPEGLEGTGQMTLEAMWKGDLYRIVLICLPDGNGGIIDPGFGP